MKEILHRGIVMSAEEDVRDDDLSDETTVYI